MQRCLCVIIIACLFIVTGCSSISTGEFFVTNGKNLTLPDKNLNWVTDTIEPSFGKIRPPLKKIEVKEGEKASLIVYPIIISEKVISFGPVLLPIIPVPAFWQDPPSKYIYRIRLLYKGEYNDVENLKILVNGKPIAKEVLKENGDILIVSDKLQNIKDTITVQLYLNDNSLTLHYQRARTFCYVPITSFN